MHRQFFFFLHMFPLQLHFDNHFTISSIMNSYHMNVFIRLSLRWMSQTLRYICLCRGKAKDILEANILGALGALHDSLGDTAAPAIWQNIIESIRSVSSEQSCDTALACSKTIAILRRAAEICVGYPTTMYSISVCIYK